MKNFDEICGFVLVWLSIAVLPAAFIAISFYNMGRSEGQRMTLSQESGFACQKLPDAKGQNAQP